MATTATVRVGLGEDSHRLAPGGPLRLGGMEIPHEQHLVGHSDADVLLHAASDALLGAAALGDIGELFPDTEPAFRGKDSGELLRRVVELVVAAGYRVVNIDCVVHAEQPRIAPHRQAMRGRIAELVGVPPERVSVKAKTGEGVGPVGRRESIDARCVALIEAAADERS